ncbi:hypothetical protein [Mucilaginibacter antarcticus]|uniref:hypothetical protein n=1 Tax=Mucilaginibacter antarcticus TaxID=1855725 RepID=UPI00364373E5
MLAPVRTYVPGSFNTVSAKITTNDGSTATVSRNTATTEGFLLDITQARDSYTVSADNALNIAESSKNLLDNNVETKFTMGGKDGRLFTYPLMTTLIYRDKQAVKTYAVSNSNDLPARDPKSWNLQGSDDGVTWEILDTRVMTKNFYDQMTALGATTDLQRFKKLFYYAIANPKPFKMYRWAITSNWGDAALQTNDFRLYK